MLRISNEYMNVKQSLRTYNNLPELTDDRSWSGEANPILGSFCWMLDSSSRPFITLSSWSRLLWKSSFAVKPATLWFFVDLEFDENGLGKDVEDELGEDVLL